MAGAAGLIATDQVGQRSGGMAILTAAATWTMLSGLEEVGRSGLASEWLGVAAGAAVLAALVRAIQPGLAGEVEAARYRPHSEGTPKQF